MGRVKKIGLNTGITLAMPLGIYFVFALLTRLVRDDSVVPFGSPDMVLTILQQSCLGILIAFGISVNMPTFRVDMSVGAVVILSAIVGARFTIQYHLSIGVMLLICVGFAVALSLVTAAAYVMLRIPMIVMSLGMVIVFEAMTGIVFGGQGVVALNPNTRLMGYQPYCFIVVIAAMILFHVVTEYTRYAYDTRLLSGNQSLAVRIGVNEVKNVFQSYALVGVFLGLAAMVYVSNYGMIEPQSNMSSGGIMFNALLPVIIGMILANWSNKAIAVSVSVISMKTVSYGLFCLGFNSTFQDVVSGSFILFMVVFTGFLAQMPERRRVQDRAKAIASIQ